VRTRHACPWSSDTPPRTSGSVESWSGEGLSRMSTKPGAGIGRIGDALASPIHTLFRARIADNGTHPANGTPSDTAGKPPRWRSRSETGEASWGTVVEPPLYTTHWGLLKQPDNQKPPNAYGSMRNAMTNRLDRSSYRLRESRNQPSLDNQITLGCSSFRRLVRCEHDSTAR